MKKFHLGVLFIVFINSFLCYNSSAQNDKIAWFRDAKFGIFIHWGLYSQIGYTEWCQNHFEMQADDYVTLAKTFNPIKYDANAWTSLIKASGAKYCVITSKHHEGFSMYDTRFSDYSIMQTPYKKDVLGMLANTLKKEKINFGIYYSVMDWHHPDYLPRRYFDRRSVSTANFANYKIFFKNQVGELIDNYQPKLMWFDGEWENTHDSLETVDIVNMMRLKQPDILFNNRLSRFSHGDFRTPENIVPATGLKDEKGNPIAWEVCHTINDSWGYDPYSNEFLSERDLIRMLIDIVSKGGNLLLNIGPKPDGSIQTEFIERLNGLGKWLSKNGESIYGTDASIFPNLPFYGRSTTKGNKIFLHVFMQPKNGILPIPMLKNKIAKVYTLVDSKPLNYKIENNQIQINLSKNSFDVNANMIVIETHEKPEIANILPIFPVENTIELNCENGNIPTENKGLEAEQYFDKMRIKKWTSKQNETWIEWKFETTKEQTFNIQINAANAYEKFGNAVFYLEIDEWLKEGQLAQREPWSFANKYVYEGVTINNITLKAGKHNIRFKANLKTDQQIIFDKIVLKTVN